MEPHDFEWALLQLKCGNHVTRSGWNGKGLSLRLRHRDDSLPYIELIYPFGDKYPAGALVPWLPSQTDLLSEDWSLST